MDLNAYVLPIIVVIDTCIGFLIKKFLGDKDPDHKWLLLITALIGVILSIVVNGFSVVAVAVGLVSGLASNGFYDWLATWIDGLSKKAE